MTWRLPWFIVVPAMNELAGPVSLDPRGEDLCAPFLRELGISGVSVSMFGGTASETLVCASDGASARLDELQFDLGEGPRWEALRTRLPVLVPDVRTTAPCSWPVLSKALEDTGIAAVFVFPLAVGALDLGVVQLHNTRPGNLNYADHTTAAVLAGQTAWHLLRRVLSVSAADTDPSVDTSLMSRREIHQATGVVLAQAGTTAAEALLLLRAHAFATAITLREAAEAVLTGHLSFAPQDGESGNDDLQ